jgi:hypothetical protein
MVLFIVKNVGHSNRELSFTPCGVLFPDWAGLTARVVF